MNRNPAPTKRTGRARARRGTSTHQKAHQMNTQQKEANELNEGVDTRVMIKCNVEALIYLCHVSFTKRGLHSSIGSMPTSKNNRY
jgi:hypothetical protein